MAGFDLVPIDGVSPNVIHLPEGETLLGRGPFLGVNDKRVSRHHGLLDNLDGQLRIKPIHVNPCFYQSSLDDPPQLLERDQWHTLRPGDIFSLLPGKYAYKVVAVDEEDGTPTNSQALPEEEVVFKTYPASPERRDKLAPTTEQDHGWTPLSLEPAYKLGASLDQMEADVELLNSPNPKQIRRSVDKVALMEAEKEKNEPKVEPKKRVLPAWMLVPAAAVKSPSTPKGAGNGNPRTAAPRSSSNQVQAKRARAKVSSSVEEESEHSEVEIKPRKRIRRKKSKEDDEVVQSKTALKVRQQVKPSSLEVSEESDQFLVEADENTGKTTGENVSATNSNSPSTSREEPSELEDRGKQPQMVSKAEPRGSADVSGPAQSRAQARTPCPYGTDCYRKNPVHFAECSHPGDSDYEDSSRKEEEDEEAEDGNQPECPYGTDCYRKNPLHRKEYRHTKKTRAKKPVSYKNNTDDGEDDFGDDDSFINDESEDVDEDSEYEPPDSDDSGEEDLKRLRKEAKDFTRRK